MSEKRQIVIFSAGCPLCQETISLVNNVACVSCDISVLDMNKSDVAKRATKLGVVSVPAVVINGQLADYCVGQSVNENILRDAGVGQPL